MKQWNEQYADDQQGEEQNRWRDRLPKMLHNLGNILDLPAILNKLNGESIQNPKSKIQNLILVPHRDLHRFPLHALFPDEFTITYLPSTQIGLSLVGCASCPPFVKMKAWFAVSCHAI